MPVNSKHPEYSQACKRWELVRQIVANDAKKHIRTVDVNDPNRSIQYKEDAILTNFTSLTKVGLTGLVFKRDPEVIYPEALSYLEEDATGTGLHLTQLAQLVVGETLITGRFGLLVDYPAVPAGMSVAEAAANQNYARVKPYPAESVINWMTKTIGSKTLLSMIVLQEYVNDVAEDGFEWVEKVQYRVLRLNDLNNYEQLVLNEDGEVLEFSVPQKADGSFFKEIPFSFVGSENNDWRVDWLPLYDLAVINLGHYRNSADYEESIFICGQPTIFMNVDGSPEEFKQAYPDGITFGSRSGYNLGAGGSAMLLQANPNQLADAAMKRKEEQAALIGARLISPAGGRETAEAARIRFESQHSALHIITENVSEAIEKSLFWVAEFMGEETTDIEFCLNKQFYDDNVDPNLLAQQILLLDRQIITDNDIRDYLRKTGIIYADRSNQDIMNEVGMSNPLVGIQDSEDEPT